MTREEKIIEVDPIVINEISYVTDSSFKKSIYEIFDYFEQQIQKLQEEKEHLKNRLKASTKDKR